MRKCFFGDLTNLQTRRNQRYWNLKSLWVHHLPRRGDRCLIKEQLNIKITMINFIDLARSLTCHVSIRPPDVRSKRSWNHTIQPHARSKLIIKSLRTLHMHSLRNLSHGKYNKTKKDCERSYDYIYIVYISIECTHDWLKITADHSFSIHHRSGHAHTAILPEYRRHTCRVYRSNVNRDWWDGWLLSASFLVLATKSSSA